MIQNIFSKLSVKLSIQDEILLFKWSNKAVTEKINDLLDWHDKFGPEANLVKAAEEILKLNYPNEYIKYMSMHQSFKHQFHFYIEDEMSSVGATIDWLNSIFNEFEGLQEGLLGGLVVTPAFEGTIISCEYEKGKLMRVLNKGDGDVADLIINGMNMPSIPKDLTVKKNATVRGIVTLADNKAKNMASSVNELLFKDNLSEDDLSKLIFIPFEWLNDDGKNINTSKEYQLIKDNGFILPAYMKSATVQDALAVYENYCQTDYGYQLKGCRIEIENATTLDTLAEIMVERNLSDYMGRVILLKA